MYRAFTFRMASRTFPLAKVTREHPEVHAIAFNFGRDAELALPTQNIYFVRGPRHLHEIVKGSVEAAMEEVEWLDSAERDVLIFRGTFQPPEKGRLRGFLGVLSEAVGTVLDYRPIIIENGTLEINMLVLPRGDTQVRIHALATFARDENIPFEVLRDDMVPTLPVRYPRVGMLDLLESQVFQAIAASGAYELDGPAVERLLKSTAADVDEALGIDEHTFRKLRRSAEKKILREFADALRRSVALNTSRRAPPAQANTD